MQIGAEPKVKRKVRRRGAKSTKRVREATEDKERYIKPTKQQTREDNRRHGPFEDKEKPFQTYRSDG